MSHEVFRYLIPGLAFLVPIFGIGMLESTPDTALSQSAGLAIAAVLPVGWIVFNSGRAIAVLTNHTYDDQKGFLDVLRERVHVAYMPRTGTVLVNLTRLLPDQPVLDLFPREFRETFSPLKLNRRGPIEPHDVERVGFLEPLSDLVTLESKSFDYARSISTMRYGLAGLGYAFIGGSIVAVAEALIFSDSLEWSGWNRLYLQLLGSLILLLLAVAVVLLMTLRYRYTSREYDARLNLITFNRFPVRRFDPTDLQVDAFEAVLQSLGEHENPAESIALFDLDETLIEGDIGEAVLRALIDDGRVTALTWREYLDLKQADPRKAFRAATEYLGGLSKKEVERATRAVLSGTAAPTPDADMQRLVARLHLIGIQCYVISASNAISARITAWEGFGIPPSRTIGVESISHSWPRGQRLTTKLARPVPIYEGKADSLDELRNGRTVVLVACEGAESDRALVEACPESATVIWVGAVPAWLESRANVIRVSRAACGTN